MCLASHLSGFLYIFIVCCYGEESEAGLFSNGINPAADIFGKPVSDIMIQMSEPMGPIINSYSRPSEGESRDEQVTNMAHALQLASLASQAPVLAALAPFNVQTESYWLTNQIYVKGASPAMVHMLQGFGVIKEIYAEKQFPLIPIFNPTVGEEPKGPLWNIKKIKADKVWKEGVKGKGVVVASIDTGVRWTHNSIKENYVGTENFGWYDPIFFTNEPYDVHGHGTHTVGTMVGNNGIGAAPKAKWMACKGCTMQSCVQHALLACGQFVLCPNNPNNKSKALNCTNVPNIVNNSWGGPGGQTWFDTIIAAWRAAGIIPFFAIGNSGPACYTSGSPGDSEHVISIGATDKDDRIANFSSRGPKVVMNETEQKGGGFFGELMQGFMKKKHVTDVIKPDMSCPGHQINSAGMMTDNAYKQQSGTSMASPLAAGATALLLSKYPKLRFEEVRELLIGTTTKKLLPSHDGIQCGSKPETEFPNNVYGHGRINIFKAYKRLVKLMKHGRKLGKKNRKKGKKGEKGEGQGQAEAVAVTTEGTVVEGRAEEDVTTAKEESVEETKEDEEEEEESKEEEESEEEKEGEKKKNGEAGDAAK